MEYTVSLKDGKLVLSRCNLKPFYVPSYMKIEFTNSKIHLSLLPTEVLDHICNQFRATVFDKAGKKDPSL